MSSVKKILVLPGDGIGPEIMHHAMRVFEVVKKHSAYNFEIVYGLIGGAAYDVMGAHFPVETRDACSNADIILFGAVGGPVHEQSMPKWHLCEVNSILALRKQLDLYANIRPVKVDEPLLCFSPLRLESFLPRVPDLVVVRELSGDVYFGEKGRRENGEISFDEATYSRTQIQRIARFAFEIAKIRKKSVYSIDKANVLETSRMWRESVLEISKEYPEVNLDVMLVDNCAMQLVNNPVLFDVVLTSNMFGDILSDAAAVIPGSLGLLASASYGSGGKWLFEPPSGSAPDIAGKNIANPIGMIRCIGMLFQMALREEHIYNMIEQSIAKMLADGVVTADIAVDKQNARSLEECSDILISNLLRLNC